MHVSAGPSEPHGGMCINLLFHPSSAPSFIFFSQQFDSFPLTETKVASSVSSKQWVNGRNMASSNTTVVFWLVTNRCCTCHLIFTLFHLLCYQTRLSSFVESTTNVQAHATHALVPFTSQLNSLKRWRPFFVDKRIKWIHFLCLFACKYSTVIWKRNNYHFQNAQGPNNGQLKVSFRLLVYVMKESDTSTTHNRT